MCMPNPVIILWSTGRTVLACKWPESGTKPDCYVRNGFSFNYIVTDRLTLEIHNETEEVAGQYACSLVPSDHRTVKMCTLIVKGKISLSLSLSFSRQAANLSETIYTFSRTKPEWGGVMYTGNLTFSVTFILLHYSLYSADIKSHMS